MVVPGDALLAGLDHRRVGGFAEIVPIGPVESDLNNVSSIPGRTANRPYVLGVTEVRAKPVDGASVS
jgi:hypothetical protein